MSPLASRVILPPSSELPLELIVPAVIASPALMTMEPPLAPELLRLPEEMLWLSLVRVILPPVPFPEEAVLINDVVISPVAVRAIAPPLPLEELVSSVPALVLMLPLLLVRVISRPGLVMLPVVILWLAFSVILA